MIPSAALQPLTKNGAPSLARRPAVAKVRVAAEFLSLSIECRFLRILPALPLFRGKSLVPLNCKLLHITPVCLSQLLDTSVTYELIVRGTRTAFFTGGFTGPIFTWGNFT
jgi:hypothetical protein